MKKNLDQIKAAFPEIDLLTQAGTKGGNGVYYSHIGTNTWSVIGHNGLSATIMQNGDGSEDPNVFNYDGPMSNYSTGGYNFLGYNSNGYGTDGYNIFNGYTQYGYDRNGGYHEDYDVRHGYDPEDGTFAVDTSGGGSGNGGSGGGGNSGGGYGSYINPDAPMPTPPGQLDFGQSTAYVAVSTQTLNMVTTEGGPVTMYITYYTYWDGTQYLSEKVEWQEYISMSNGSTNYWDFGSHNENFIMGNYNRPADQIPNQNTLAPADDIYGYFTDLNLVTDPNAFDADGYNAFGFDASGFDRSGISMETGTPYNSSGFDEFGLSAIGIPKEEYDANGGYVDGFNANGYSTAGYSAYYYEIYGGYINGYDQFGVSAAGYSAQDYANAGGYINGFDERGISAAGHTIEDYQLNDGFINGLDQFGNPPEHGTNSGSTRYLVSPDASGTYFDEYGEQIIMTDIETENNGGSGEPGDPEVKIDQYGHKWYRYDGDVWQNVPNTETNTYYASIDDVYGRIVAQRDATYVAFDPLAHGEVPDNQPAPHLSDVFGKILWDTGKDAVLNEAGSAIHLSKSATSWLIGMKSASDDFDGNDLLGAGYDIGKVATGLELTAVESVYKALNTQEGIDWLAQSVLTNAVEDLYRANTYRDQKDIDNYLKDYQMLLDLYKRKTGNNYYDIFPQPTVIRQGH